jgi:hypothetical protein
MTERKNALVPYMPFVEALLKAIGAGDISQPGHGLVEAHIHIVSNNVVTVDLVREVYEPSAEAESVFRNVKQRFRLEPIEDEEPAQVVLVDGPAP